MQPPREKGCRERSRPTPTCGGMHRGIPVARVPAAARDVGAVTAAPRAIQDVDASLPAHAGVPLPASILTPACRCCLCPLSP